MRNCVYCGPKEDTEFNKRGNTFQSVCRKCQNEVSKKHYNDNKASYQKRIKERKQQLRAFIQELKTDKPCKDCGIVYHYYVMEFDHLGDKDFEIASAANRGLSMETIEREISKCDLVCANCHRTRTFNRLTPGSFNG